MQITSFTIKQADQIVGTTPVREQAVRVAKARAQQTGTPVSVIAYLDTGKEREVIFHPDGTNERIWAIDKGQRIQPIVGEVYTNRGGRPLPVHRAGRQRAHVLECSRRLQQCIRRLPKYRKRMDVYGQGYYPVH